LGIAPFTYVHDEHPGEDRAAARSARTLYRLNVLQLDSDLERARVEHAQHIKTIQDVECLIHRQSLKNRAFFALNTF